MSELPDTNLAEGRRWLAQVRGDLAAAEGIAADPEYPDRLACFLSHLAVEKALKALLIALGLLFRKVHDLTELSELIPSHLEGRFDEADLVILNPWTTEGRYPGGLEDASPAQARACLDAASRVVTTVHEVFPDAKDGEGEDEEE